MFYSGQKTYWETYTLAHLPDDMTVGLVIGNKDVKYTVESGCYNFRRKLSAIC